MPPKKKDGRMTNAEKQRLYRERRRLMDPEKEKENKIKDRERYHAKKKIINELSEREKRCKRKNTRERVRRFREKQRKKADDAVQLATLSSSKKSNIGRKKVRRDRSKLYRENQMLRKQLSSARKIADMHRKRAQRVKIKFSRTVYKTPDIHLTPKSLTRKTIHECFRKGIRNAKEKVARKLFLHNAMTAAIKENYTKSSTKEKRNFKQVVSQTLLKYRLVRPSLANYLGLKRGFRKTVVTRVKENTMRKKVVEAFFARDDNSRATSGKKETKTRKKEKRQKRFLTDSVKALHQKYVAEGNKISYETFRKSRPFHVVNPTANDRESCLCELHSNLNMKAKKLTSLKICSYADLNQLASLIVCDTESKDRMYKQCINCNTKEVPLNMKESLNTITWFEWTKVVEEVKVTKSMEETRKIKKVIKEKKKGSEEELCKKFQLEMKKFCSHSYNIKQQYAAYRQCRDNLMNNEAMIHIDFAENYSCKMGEEVQSYHFGGSRNQVTLHTGVLYIRSHILPISFCTISPDRRHSPAAIWAHLEPIFKMIRKIAPSVKVIHFFSDGPTTQYRQKQNFYLLNNQLYYFGFERATWNFFEAGHGKGAGDGVGAALKRKADKRVAFGQDIVDAHQFYEAVKESKIKVFWIEEHDIDFIEQSIPAYLTTLKGTMKIHQIATMHKAGTLLYRDVSCFCGEQRGLCSCFEYKIFQMQILHRNQNAKKNEDNDGSPLSDLESTSTNDENLGAYETAFIGNELTEVTPNRIVKGTFLLVELLTEKKKKMKHFYIAVTQDDLEDDGDVRVMFLKAYDDTATMYKADDTDIAYVHYEQIKKNLPMPAMIQRGDRLFYKFPYSIEIFQKSM